MCGGGVGEVWGRCGVRGDAVRDTEVAQHLHQGGVGARCESGASQEGKRAPI